MQPHVHGLSLCVRDVLQWETGIFTRVMQSRFQKTLVPVCVSCRKWESSASRMSLASFKAIAGDVKQMRGQEGIYGISFLLHSAGYRGGWNMIGDYSKIIYRQNCNFQVIKLLPNTVNLFCFVFLQALTTISLSDITCESRTFPTPPL